MFGDMLTDLMNCGHFQATKIYRDENGGVFLGLGKRYCYIAVVKRVAPAQDLIRERGHLDYISAVEFFDTAVRYVRGEIEWTEPVKKYSCKYNPKKSKSCCSTNCPQTLGGAAYWEIFARNCLHRKSRAR